MSKLGSLILVAVMTVASGGGARAQPADAAAQLQPLLDAYYACSREAARRMEPSQESAEAIGRASRAYCAREAEAAAQMWIKINPASAPGNIDRTLSWADTVATAEVVAARLCRIAKDCRSF